MDGRKRTVQIKFRVTEAERDLILEKMKLVPTRNMAAYLRKIAIDGYIIQIDHADIKAMTAEIQKIGVNVNQIARRVNATGNAYQEDIEEIKGVLAEILRHTEHERQAVPGKWLVRRRPRQGQQGKELCGVPGRKDGYKLERQAENRR